MRAVLARAVMRHLLALTGRDWICIGCVSGIVAAVVWPGWECSGMQSAIAGLRARMQRLESRQDRLQGLVQKKDWRDSLDLTRWDWSKK